MSLQMNSAPQVVKCGQISYGTFRFRIILKSHIEHNRPHQYRTGDYCIACIMKTYMRLKFLNLKIKSKLYTKSFGVFFKMR